MAVSSFKQAGLANTNTLTVINPNADFSNTPTGTYTDGSGFAWKYVQFNASGTLTITTAGLADVWILGGGCGSFAGAWSGGAGGLLTGFRNLSVGALTVTVGAGGDGNGGGLSSIGSLVTQMSPLWVGLGGTNSTNGTGLSSSITGTSVLYGRGGVASPIANRGEGVQASGTVGSSGVVIVRVRTN